MILNFQRYRRRSDVRWLSVVIAVLVICVSPVSAQTSTSTAGKATPWTFQKQPDPNELLVAFVSDRAANPREGVFEAALVKLQLLRPDFVLSIGDFIQGYNEETKPLTDEAAIRAKRHEFDGFLRVLTMPFFRVPGNHDVNNDLSAGIWKELYGPAYYSFVHKGVLFLCLNSQDGENYHAGIGAKQRDWVGDVLDENRDARWMCLFCHQPLWLEDEKRTEQAAKTGGRAQLTGFGQIEELLEGHNYTVFAGHHHRYGKWVKNGNKYFRLATTGGQSGLRGPEAGQFDHVMWVTMTGDGPIFCNLLLEGILDEDAKANMPQQPAPAK